MSGSNAIRHAIHCGRDDKQIRHEYLRTSIPDVFIVQCFSHPHSTGPHFAAVCAEVAAFQQNSSCIHVKRLDLVSQAVCVREHRARARRPMRIHHDDKWPRILIQACSLRRLFFFLGLALTTSSQSAPQCIIRFDLTILGLRFVLLFSLNKTAIKKTVCRTWRKSIAPHPS